MTDDPDRVPKSTPEAQHSGGWVLVPREPTEAMVEAHFAAHARSENVFASVPEIWAAMIAASPSASPGDAVQRPDAQGASSPAIDYQQRRGALADIIDQAIAEYDGWALDDDYDAQACLERIVGRMRERRALYQPLPREAAPSSKQDQPDPLAQARLVKAVRALLDNIYEFETVTDGEFLEAVETALQDASLAKDGGDHG